MFTKTILVTGFGPYGENGKDFISWEAVKLLDKMQFSGYNLIMLQVPVSYTYVNENILRLWEEHNPTFVMHVGLTNATRALRLETCANRRGYISPDADGDYHPTGEVCTEYEGPDLLYSQIDVQRIVNELKHDRLKFVKSNDAGLYLCEYMYYKSLNVDNSRILLIHIPQLYHPYSTKELAVGLTMIINAALEQLDELKAKRISAEGANSNKSN